MKTINNSFIIIDDDDIFLKIHDTMLRRAFPEMGMTIFRLSIEALAFLQEHKMEHCVFFIDLRMPELSGFEILEEIQKLLETHFTDCKFFVLTSSLDERDREKVMQFSFVNDYWDKPLQIPNLKKLL